MKKRKTLATMLIISLAVSSITGCKKKDENELTKEDYMAMYEQTANELANATDTIENLRMELNAYGEEMTKDDITQPYELMEDGSTKNYNTFNNFIIFKSKLDWQTNERIGNTSKVKLDESFCLTPSNTWSVKISSGNTQMYNDSNIAGKLSLSDFYESMDSTFLFSEYIKPYLDEIGAKKITNTNIYLDGATCGTLSRSIISVNKKVYTEEKMKVREDFLQNGNKELLDAIEAEQKAKEKAEKKAAKEAKKNGSKATEEPVQSLDDIAGESTEQPNGLGNSIDTSGSSSAVTSTPEVSLAPGETPKPTSKPEYKNVTVTTTEKQKVEYVYYVGAVNANNEILQYQFIFENDENAKVKEELIVQLLKSIQIGEVNLTLE